MGFSAHAIQSRVEDADCKLIVTADGGWRRGDVIELKPNRRSGTRGGLRIVENVVVVERTKNPIDWTEDRDHWWHDVVADQADPTQRAAFPRSTRSSSSTPAGTTGTPKGVVHSTAGYALWTKLTSKWVFDLKDDDMYWCTADIGWITGHSYIVYGPLQMGATSLMYEGAPNWPEPDRFWDIVERHRVNIFYTAPTAIRAFMKWGDEHVEKHDLSSLSCWAPSVSRSTRRRGCGTAR